MRGGVVEPGQGGCQCEDLDLAQHLGGHGGVGEVGAGQRGAGAALGPPGPSGAGPAVAGGAVAGVLRFAELVQPPGGVAGAGAAGGFVGGQGGIGGELDVCPDSLGWA